MLVHFQPRKCYINEEDIYKSTKESAFFSSMYCRTAIPGSRAEELDNGPQTQWNFCVCNTDHFWNDKMGRQTWHYLFYLDSFWTLADSWRVKAVRNCDSFVGIVTRWGCMICDLNSSWGKSVFSKTSRLALGPTQPSVQWVLGALSLGVKWAVHGLTTDHHLMLRLRCVELSPICLCSIYKDNFTCTFYHGLNLCIYTRIAWDAS